MEYAAITAICSVVSILLVIVGGFFALHQWRVGNAYKRASILKELIAMIRDDAEVASVFDTIDWNGGFYYDGEFHLSYSEREKLRGLSEADFFRMIDKTLFRLSYICYLRSRHIISKHDMILFEYSLRRVSDNKHIANYLYSVYHWSCALNVTASFNHLIQYYLKRGYLKPSFKTCPSDPPQDSSDYQCFLQLPDTYLVSNKG